MNREVIEDYRSQGFVVQPVYGYANGLCGCGSPECSPRDRGKHAPRAWEYPYTPPVIFPPDTNIAIRGGTWGGSTSLVVLDLDREVPASLMSRLPPTRIHQTPRGLHYFYTMPQGHRLKNWNDVWGTWGAGKWWMDVRVEKGRVLVPPSVTPWGEYQLLNGMSPGPLPLDIYEDILERKDKERQ